MKKLYIAAVLALLLAACNNKENLSSESVLKPRTTAQTALDTYIYNNFQQPYNIIVTYNYIDADFEMGKYLYPPTESKVQPMLEIVKKVWIDSYTQVAGQDFIKSVAPRQIWGENHGCALPVDKAGGSDAYGFDVVRPGQFLHALADCVRHCIRARRRRRLSHEGKYLSIVVNGSRGNLRAADVHADVHTHGFSLTDSGASKTPRYG